MTLTVTADDLDTLARTIYGEARGSTFDDRVAVAWVVLNRALASARKPMWWGSGIAGVCRKPFQFSCWNAGDPNRPKILAATLDDPLFCECLGIAALVTAAARGRAKAIPADFKDRTDGATHYHTTAMGFPKTWGAEKTPVAVIGAHSFYNDIA